jgi:hypothetical protein
MQCGEPAIRAHSIQNRQTIALLEQDNHVLAWQPRFSQDAYRRRYTVVRRLRHHHHVEPRLVKASNLLWQVNKLTYWRKLLSDNILIL